MGTLVCVVSMVISLLVLGCVMYVVLTTIRRDWMAIRAMKACLARSRKLYAQSMAATTDAERGCIIEELLKG